MLIVMDGWGEDPASSANAISAAHTPNVNGFYESRPYARLRTSGEDVGLPEGQVLLGPQVQAMSEAQLAQAGGQRTAEVVTRWWRVIRRRGSRIRPGAVDHAGVVAGHIDDLRLGRLDDDALRFRAYHLLLVRFQIAVVLRLLPKPLDRGHDVFLLAEEGVAV
mgnify:CR=1 FL=1